MSPKSTSFEIILTDFKLCHPHRCFIVICCIGLHIYKFIVNFVPKLSWAWIIMVKIRLFAFCGIICRFMNRFGCFLSLLSLRERRQLTFDFFNDDCPLRVIFPATPSPSTEMGLLPLPSSPTSPPLTPQVAYTSECQHVRHTYTFYKTHL